MKIRIKFAKQGAMKFVGHLDIMRYFQKAMRRADVDIAYSEGFSPHQKMSFAAPLGVGLISQGEYFDIEVHSTDSSSEMLNRLNAAMVDGMSVLSYRLLPEDSKNAMSIVAAADYLVSFRKGMAPCENIADEFERFMSEEKLEVVKATKKSEVVVDIKPMILAYEVQEYQFQALEEDILKDNRCEADDTENVRIFLKLLTGSENNLKPELVIQAFYEYLDKEQKAFDIISERLEIYGKAKDGGLIALEDFGKDII